jgi:lipopolysaccharide export system protein LptA
MAEISLRQNFIRFFVCIIAFLLVSSVLHSQTSGTGKTGKKIEIIYADVLVIDDKNIHHLTGQVQIRHNETLMRCDSAHHSPDTQEFTAFSRVHVEQGDTLNLYGDYLYYTGRTERALVRGNVELIDKETHLYTDEIDYDLKNKVARYDKRGRIINADNTLTSIHGVYYVADNLFHFKDSVKIVNPDYVMTADTMDYNTKTEISYFTGPTEMKGDSIYLYCEKGWYDTKNEVTSVWKNALIDNRKQIVSGDSLFYNDSTGYGEAYRNVLIRDTANNLALEGNYAWYYKQPERFLVTDRAVFIQISEGDSLFLHADTISAVTVSDTAGAYRLMRAYHGCRVFSRQLQAKCDSLAYSFQDSVIRFYVEPVMWTEENQLVADSMALFTKNQQPERLELYSSAFVTIQVDSVRFNQIKGRTLTGLFRENELRDITVDGNCESIYYLIEDESIAGVNQSKAAKIEATVIDGKIAEITDFGSPGGFIDPPASKKPEDLRLENFAWYDKIRPKQKSDIFKEF